MGNQKVPQKAFDKILADNHGLFAQTAKAVEKMFGITYTRQAVEVRAKKKPELLEQIRESWMDIAEANHVNFMLSKTTSVKQRATEFHLKHQGKHRGWTERTEVDNVTPSVVINEVRTYDAPDDTSGDQ